MAFDRSKFIKTLESSRVGAWLAALKDSKKAKAASQALGDAMQSALADGLYAHDAEHPNLVFNGDFELLNDDGSLPPPGWSVNVNGVEYTDSATWNKYCRWDEAGGLSDLKQKSGYRALTIDPDGVVTGEIGVHSDLFTVRGDMLYEVGLAYKPNSNDSSVVIDYQFAIEWFYDSKTPHSTSFITAERGYTQDVWFYPRATLTAPQTARYARIRVRHGTVTPTSHSSFNLDRVYVRPAPRRIFFFAYRDTSNQTIGIGATERVVFNNESQDIGDQYNPATGTFTCKYPGVYIFTASVQLNSLSDQQEMYMAIRVRGSDNAKGGNSSASGIQHVGASCSIVSLLAVNDTVEVWCFNGDSASRFIAISASNSFSGARISP